MIFRVTTSLEGSRTASRTFFIKEVIRSVTRTPASCLGLQAEYGEIETGRKANLTLLRPVRKKVTFYDSQGQTRTGEKLLSPEMTMIGGKILCLQGAASLEKG